LLIILPCYRKTLQSKMRTGGVHRHGPCPTAVAQIPASVTAHHAQTRRGTGSEGSLVAHPDLEALQSHADPSKAAPTAESSDALDETLTPPSSTRLPRRRKTADAESVAERGRKRTEMANQAAPRGVCESPRDLT
jgi:hypothetical protein